MSTLNRINSDTQVSPTDLKKASTLLVDGFYEAVYGEAGNEDRALTEVFFASGVGRMAQRWAIVPITRAFLGLSMFILRLALPGGLGMAMIGTVMWFRDGFEILYPEIHGFTMALYCVGIALCMVSLIFGIPKLIWWMMSEVFMPRQFQEDVQRVAYDALRRERRHRLAPHHRRLAVRRERVVSKTRSR